MKGREMVGDGDDDSGGASRGRERRCGLRRAKFEEFQISQAGCAVEN